MPQLDWLAYVSEVVWLIICFLGLYVLVKNHGLGDIYKILVYRVWKNKERQDKIKEKGCESFGIEWIVSRRKTTLSVNKEGVLRRLQLKFNSRKSKNIFSGSELKLLLDNELFNSEIDSIKAVEGEALLENNINLLKKVVV